MDDELIEKVARAVAVAGGYDPYYWDSVLIPKTDSDSVRVFKIYARAAIQAVREAGWKSEEEIDDLLERERDNCAIAVKEGYDL